MKRHIQLALERALALSEKQQGEFKILDVGCGRGSNLAALRRNGWECYGAEIDPNQAELARTSMVNLGHDPNVIFDITPDGAIGCEQESFDLVVSEQVLEHVIDLDMFARETRRVLGPKGAAFHVFPSRWRVIEPHVKQPLVHWLSDGLPRHLAVRLWVGLGVESGAVRHGGGNRNDILQLPPAERTRLYESYLSESTHYRSNASIHEIFLNYFERLDNRIISDFIAELAGMRTLARATGMTGLLTAACTHLYGSAIFLEA